MALLQPKRRSYSLNSQGILLFIGVLASCFHCGQSCDLTSPCKSTTKQCSNGKCTTMDEYGRHTSQATASLAAVITVCTILMLCFWGLICFACLKQCKECGPGANMSSCNSNSTINSVAVDISSIDIPDDFFRNARIPSVEEYSGPPPYLCLFNPKTKQLGTEIEEVNSVVKPGIQLDGLPPRYVTLFSDKPPSYHEVVMQVQTTV